MDMVLEIVDAFIADPIYATLHPASRLSAASQHASATLSSVREGATSVFTKPYEYEPSSKYLRQYLPTPSHFAYESAWTRDNPYRQFLTLFLITWVFGMILYFICASASYRWVFDKTTFTHPKFLKNQIKLEIKQSLESMPGMAMCTAPLFLAEVRGYTKLYDSPSEAPFPLYNYLQFPLFLLFTDCLIYFIHRGLHHPAIYKRLHKAHHKWIMPTPFASHAFHPLDGFFQSVPYHVFPLLFPLQKVASVALFVFVNIWTILIHDGEYVSENPVINGAACHSAHHLYFNYNYGQYTTLWDRLGGSYRKPNKELFDKSTKMGKEEWDRQSKEMEKIVKEVEGSDDRSYGSENGELKRVNKKKA
ncbi:MAG: hypothetical protein Q9227_006335 [Pyrenula ochraceoflavens]